MYERDLEAEINSLIHNLNGTTFEPTKDTDPGTAGLYPIEKKISKLKKELCDTQSMFINAKNLLSDISFENVDKNFGNEISSIGEKCQLMLNDERNEENFFENLCKVIHQFHDIPELHTMATAVRELKCGISKMERNHLLLADLYEDGWKSVACSDADNNLLVARNLEQVSAEKTLADD